MTARSACCGVSVALAVLLVEFGSNWSAVAVAVLVCAVGLATLAWIVSVSCAPLFEDAHGPGAGDVEIVPLAGRVETKGHAGRQQIVE